MRKRIEETATPVEHPDEPHFRWRTAWDQSNPARHGRGIGILEAVRLPARKSVLAYGEPKSSPRRNSSHKQVQSSRIKLGMPLTMKISYSVDNIP